MWPENLRPFVDTLSRWVGHRFDDTDWIGLEAGLDDTNAESERWFAYTLVRVHGAQGAPVDLSLRVRVAAATRVETSTNAAPSTAPSTVAIDYDACGYWVLTVDGTRWKATAGPSLDDGMRRTGVIARHDDGSVIFADAAGGTIPFVPEGLPPSPVCS